MKKLFKAIVYIIGGMFVLFILISIFSDPSDLPEIDCSTDYAFVKVQMQIEHRLPDAEMDLMSDARIEYIPGGFDVYTSFVNDGRRYEVYAVTHCEDGDWEVVSIDVQ